MIVLVMPETEVGAFLVPPVELRQGMLTELQLLPGRESSDTEELLELMKRRAATVSVGVKVANAVGSRATGWLDRIVRRRTDVFAAAATGCSVSDVARACQRCGLDSGAAFTALSWTDRKMLDLDLALSSEVVVVDDAGLDPTGEERFVGFLKERLRNAKSAVLALRHPVVSFDGKETVQKSFWSDRGIIVPCPCGKRV